MMFREKPITKLYAFAMAAVFALVLAGCGGGGGTAAAPDPEPPAMPEPTPQEMCEGDGGRYNADGSCTSAEELAAEMAEAEALSGAQEAAMAAYMMAMGYAGSAKDPVAMANAQAQADMAKGASDMAAAATTSAMAMEYQMKAEMYRDMAMEASMARGLGLTMLANKITNQSAIDNAVLENKPPVKAVSNEGRVGDALGTAADQDATVAVIAAVTGPPALEAVVTVDQGLAAGSEASARATHNPAGPRFTVTLGTGDVLRGENPTPLMTAGEKPTGGWPGAELVRTDTATPGKTYVNVFSDINPPTQAYTDPTPNTNTQLTLPATPAVSIVTGDVPNDGSSFTATFNANSTDNNPPESGKFVCPSGTVGGCAISVDADGVVKSVTGYEFHAKAAGLTETDADYLAWGYWLTVPDVTATAPATTAATAGAFASGNKVFTVKAALKGTATYNGDASGMYSAGGMVEYFNADVSLTANFGGTVGADTGAVPGTPNTDLLGAVSGSVSNIKAGGMDVEGSLSLKRATIESTGGADTTAGFTGDTSGTLAGRAMSGNWGGQFYGPSSATGKAAQTQYPTTAAGTFGATAPADANNPKPFRVLGSFGAWKAE